jgi:hypothetical protein
MLNGRSVFKGRLGAVASVLAAVAAMAGCGEPQSLGDVPTGGAETGGVATGGSDTGGESGAGIGGEPAVGGTRETGGGPAAGGSGPGGETGAGGDPVTGGTAAGGASTGGGTAAGGESTGGSALEDRDYELEGIGGHYNAGTQQTAAGKLDLLFVVDNSISMADKQELLALAVPQMVERLVNPRCVDSTGQPIADQPATGLDACPEGSTREIAPVTDMHVGVITSSLGGHGGVLCSPAIGAESFDPTQDDRGELIAPLRGLDSYLDQGFIKWDPLEQYAGDSLTVDALVAAVAEQIQAAGEQGCGHEATLESWYRFLIDPEPPAEVVSDGSYTYKQGTNETLLAQRAAFLRPDSSVAIVLLSDENDCSVRDGGVGWLMGDHTTRIPRGTEACLTDPNDPCCRSCALAEDEPPSGCGAVTEDPHCALGSYHPNEESLNLRCWQQKRRFGLDLLYSTDRYVRALTHETVFRDSDGTEVTNPLFAGGERDPSMVSLVGIVGVPWQALARSLSDAAPLRYKPASQLHSEGAWTALVGNPRDNVPPADPFMVESIDPRTGTSPLTELSPESVTAPAGASPVNGHEYTIPQRDDLQYACVYPLMTVRDCATTSGGCDCKSIDGGPQDRPLCQAPGTTTYGTIQYAAKAYPGLRHLEVMRRIGDLAVPASICPREATDATDPEFGYAPVVEAMIDRLRNTLE